MQIYLPIAEISLDVFLLLGLGGLIGFLSGMFGVGGGFLMTPMLIFIGVPPTVAVATQANHVVASSVSGVFAHFKRDNVDVKMGLVLLAGGFLGSTVGVSLFSLLRGLGQIDLVINLAYVVLLSVIGILLILEGGRALVRRRRKSGGPSRPRRAWAAHWPLRMRFPKSRLYISALLPLSLGFGVGVLSAIMGVGGGFILVPLMIYVLGMPTTVVIGTSLFQIIFVSANVTFLQATQNQTVDLVLALLLVVGGVIGAQFGGRFAARLPADSLRIMLGLLIIGVAGKLLVDLVTAPVDVYALGTS
jgi:hypothetical protein